MSSIREGREWFELALSECTTPEMKEGFRRAAIRLVAMEAPEKLGAMTTEEGRQTDLQECPYRQWKGTPNKDVPLDYLRYICDGLGRLQRYVNYRETRIVGGGDA